MGTTNVTQDITGGTLPVRSASGWCAPAEVAEHDGLGHEADEAHADARHGQEDKDDALQEHRAQRRLVRHLRTSGQAQVRC